MIVVISVTMTFAQGTEATKSNDYHITVTGSGASRDDAIKIALREAIERAVGVFVYTTTSVENYQLLKDEILTATRGMVQDYDILKEEQSDKIYFLTLKVRVKADEIKNKIDRSQKAITYDNALKDYSLIQSRKEKLKKYIELLKAINDRPLQERYSVDYTGYEIVHVGLNQTKVNIKARIAINPFFWDTYYKIIELISDDCSQEDSVKLCTYLYDNQLKSANQGKKYCVNADVYPYLLHRTPVDLKFFLKNKKEGKKGFFGSSGSSKDSAIYTRFIGALDENLLTNQQGYYLDSDQFGTLLKQKYMQSACVAKRDYTPKADCYWLNKESISRMNSVPDVLNRARPKGECKLIKQLFHIFDANGKEIVTEFIFYNEEDVKELHSVKVNIQIADFEFGPFYGASGYTGSFIYPDNCDKIKPELVA